MKKILFIISLTVFSSDQIYAQGLLFTKPKKNLFEIENIKEISSSHKKIAILPFKTLISYQHPEKNKDSQLEQVKNQQNLSYLWQLTMYERFTKKIKNLNVEVQNIQETNQILIANNYLKNFKKYSPIDLCKMLNVDAIIFSTYDLSLDNDEKTLLGAGFKVIVEASSQELPGLNPNLINELISDPGGYVDKLKSGDINQLLSLTADFIGVDENTRKIVDVAIANSDTIVKLTKGDTDDLLQNILVDNAELIGNQIGGKEGETVTNLIKKNKNTIQNLMNGETENLFSDLFSDNLSLISEKLGADNNKLISNIIANNSSLIKTALKGDTSNMFQQIIANNANLIGEQIGDENAKKYTDLLLNNPNLIKNIVNGNTTELLNDALAKSPDLLGMTLNPNQVKQFSSLIENNSSLIKKALQGDTSNMFQQIIANNANLIGEQINDENAKKYTDLFLNNQDLIKNIVNGNTTELLNEALTKSPDLLGSALNSDQVKQFSSLIENNKALVQNLTTGNPADIIGSTLNKLSTEKLDLSKTKIIGDALIKNPDLIANLNSENLDGFKNKLQNIIPNIGQKDIAEYTNLLTSNKSEINKLFNINTGLINNAENFLNPEMITNLSKSFGTDENFIGGIISGQSNIMIDQIMRSSEIKNLGLDQTMINEIAGLFMKDRTNVAKVLAGEAVSFYEATGELTDSNFSIKVISENEKKGNKGKEKIEVKKKNIFNKATDLYLTGSTKNNTSEKMANFLSGKKGDISKISFSIFDSKTGGLTWNFIDLEENTNVYDMEDTLEKLIKKFYKKIPYIKE